MLIMAIVLMLIDACCLLLAYLLSGITVAHRKQVQVSLQGSFALSLDTF